MYGLLIDVGSWHAILSQAGNNSGFPIEALAYASYIFSEAAFYGDVNDYINDATSAKLLAYQEANPNWYEIASNTQKEALASVADFNTDDASQTAPAVTAPAVPGTNTAATSDAEAEADDSFFVRKPWIGYVPRFMVE